MLQKILNTRRDCLARQVPKSLCAKDLAGKPPRCPSWPRGVARARPSFVALIRRGPAGQRLPDFAKPPFEGHRQTRNQPPRNAEPLRRNQNHPKGADKEHTERPHTSAIAKGQRIELLKLLCAGARTVSFSPEPKQRLTAHGTVQACATHAQASVTQASYSIKHSRGANASIPLLP